MLYVSYIDGSIHCELEWHFGEPIPDLSDFEITSIQADSGELDLIRSRYKNVPIHAGRIVEWYGEMAKFIFLNLRHLNI